MVAPILDRDAELVGAQMFSDLLGDKALKQGFHREQEGKCNLGPGEGGVAFSLQKHSAPHEGHCVILHVSVGNAFFKIAGDICGRADLGETVEQVFDIHPVFGALGDAIEIQQGGLNQAILWPVYMKGIIFHKAALSMDKIIFDSF